LLRHPYQRDERAQPGILQEAALGQVCFQVLEPSLLSAPSKLFVSEGQAGEGWGYTNIVMPFLPPTKIQNTCLLEGNQVRSARPTELSNRTVKTVVTSNGLTYCRTQLQPHRFKRHLLYDVTRPAVPVNSALLTTTLHSSGIKKRVFSDTKY
jgi:hypothetical protein